MINNRFYLSTILCGLLLVSTVACNSGKKASESSSSTESENEITDTEREFLGEIEKYVAESLDENGTLPVKTIDGDSVDFDGPLEMTKLHRKKVITYDEDQGIYFVCSNFKSNPKEGEGTKYDFDFFMTKTKDGWTLTKNLDWPAILLHKIEGEEQVTYKDNKPVAVESG
jgi:hypothetical protein